MSPSRGGRPSRSARIVSGETPPPFPVPSGAAVILSARPAQRDSEGSASCQGARGRDEILRRCGSCEAAGAPQDDIGQDAGVVRPPTGWSGSSSGGTRSPALMAAVVVLAAALCRCVGAQTLGFERPEQGWTTLAGSVAWQQGQAVEGRGSLSLESSVQTEAWAVSDPVDALVAGTVAEVSLAVRRLSGTGELGLALVSEPRLRPEAVVWRGVPKADTGWHRLSLRLVTGLGRARLAVGAVGEGGRWLIDDIRVSAAQVPPVTRPVPRTTTPVYSEPLPAAWDPGGDLDLRKRTIMGVASYYLQPGPVELNPLRELTLRRGERVGMDLDALSRGNAAKRMQIEVSGPTGWRTERRDLPVGGKRGLTVNVPLQPLLVGDTRVRVRFTCEGDAAQMPLLVHCTRYYPALGALWDVASAAETALAPFVQLPTQLHQLALGPPLAAGPLARLAATGADLAVTWSGPVADLVAGYRELPASLRAALSAVGLATATPPEQAALFRAVRDLSPEAVVMSPPFALRPTAAGLQGAADLAPALTAGLAQACDVLTVRLPAAAGSAVLREAVDGRAVTGAMAAWCWFDRSRTLGGLRDMLNAQGAALPLSAQGVGGTSTGDPALDAFLMARTLVHVFASGANAVTVPAVAPPAGGVGLLAADKPTSPLLEVYGELTRELAGVRSLSPPQDTEVASYGPGKPVSYRHFLRGDEGIIVLWNNSATVQSVAVDVRCPPTQLRLLRLSYPGQLIVREYTSVFEWDLLARHWGQPAVYVELQPLQVVVAAMKLRGAVGTWLREVGPRPPNPPAVDPMGWKEFDEKLWGPK